MMKEKMKKDGKEIFLGKIEPFRKPDNFFLPFFAWLC